MSVINIWRIFQCCLAIASLLFIFPFLHITYNTQFLFHSHFLSLECFHISFIHCIAFFSLLLLYPSTAPVRYNHILLAHFTWNPNHSHSNKYIWKKKSKPQNVPHHFVYTIHITFVDVLPLRFTNVYICTWIRTYYNVYIFILCVVCVRVYFLILLILSICLVLSMNMLVFSRLAAQTYTRVDHIFHWFVPYMHADHIYRQFCTAAKPTK